MHRFCSLTIEEQVKKCEILCFPLQFIFAIVGVQLFNGKFFYCTDLSKHSAAECQGQYFLFADETNPPSVVVREWVRKPFHYDNCFMAMLTLFAVQTSEGWVA